MKNYGAYIWNVFMHRKLEINHKKLNEARRIFELNKAS